MGREATMGPTRTLTRRQREVYEFIRDTIRRRGYGPTVREIGQHFAIRSPNGVVGHLKALEKKGVIKREPRMSRSIQLLQEPDEGIPLAGVIAAGQPLEAIEQAETLDLTAMFPHPDCFALRVRGDSMIEDQICDGDFVIAERREEARDSQIVVALLDDGEATLKRYYRERGRIRLEPANAAMRPIYANHVRVLGVVIGVVRRYNP